MTDAYIAAIATNAIIFLLLLGGAYNRERLILKEFYLKFYIKLCFALILVF